VDGRVPVLPGVGFGHSIAAEMLSAAQELGADGALVFPPYMSQSSSAGQHDYFASLAAGCDLGLLLYQRDWTVFTPDEVARLATVPNIAGLKDGTGRVDLLVKQIAAVSDKNFGFFNGAPTAELIAPAMQAIGVTSYSSALLNFVPEIARAFHLALTSGDQEAVADLMNRAVVPFVRLRDRAPGYAVSLVKAGVAMRGLEVGPVRAPLEQPGDDDLRDLRRYLETLDLDHPLHPPGSRRGVAAANASGNGYGIPGNRAAARD
jgi:5-dehydro-4-deoxyglucarate dehydratase